ncbi:MAG TPA: hypothetical protein VD788_02475 [Candidatus Polarisedimenticolaceae bacterium]|nr:hypothetical protein [Candidatus Polarisedimenticolaceae bacterium]
MNVGGALSALARSPDRGFAVVVMRKRRDRLTAAPVLGAAADEEAEEVALLIGAFSDEEDALDGAVAVGDVLDALGEIATHGGAWPVFSAEAGGGAAAEGGSLVGFSIDDEVEIFAFLEGPKSVWDD